MIVELNYVLFSLLLVIYATWRFFKRREKSMLYMTFSFIFLTLSITLLMSNSLLWFPATITTLRLLEVGGLGLYACFIICAIVSLRKLYKTELDES